MGVGGDQLQPGVEEGGTPTEVVAIVEKIASQTSGRLRVTKKGWLDNKILKNSQAQQMKNWMLILT